MSLYSLLLIGLWGFQWLYWQISPLTPVLEKEVNYVLFLQGIFILVSLCLIFLVKRWKTRELASLSQGEILARKPKNYMLPYLHQNLMEVRRQLEDSQQKALREQEAFSDYMTHAVHDLKIPVTTLQLIVEEEKALGEIKKLEHMIDRLLYMTKVTSFTQDFVIQEVDLKESLHQELKELRQYFLNKKIRLSVDIEAVKVSSDDKWLRYLLRELLSNSLKYAPSGSLITIQGRILNQVYELLITDQGKGIQPEDLPRIFQRGYTGRNQIKSHSTGLGLYLAKEIAQGLDHGLSIGPAPRGGTQCKVVMNLTKV